MLTLNLTYCEKNEENKLENKSDAKKLNLPWKSILPSKIDNEGSSAYAEKYFKRRNLIGMCLGSKCDKNVTQTCDKCINCFHEHIIISNGDGMERTLVMGMQCKNDRSKSSHLKLKSTHDQMLAKFDDGSSDDHLADENFLACAIKSIRKGHFSVDGNIQSRKHK